MGAAGVVDDVGDEAFAGSLLFDFDGIGLGERFEKGKTFEAAVEHAESQVWHTGYITDKSPLVEYLLRGIEITGIQYFDYQPAQLVTDRIRIIVAKLHSDGFLTGEAIQATERRIASLLHDYLIDATICHVPGCEGDNELIHNDLLGSTGWRVWKCDTCGCETANRDAPERHGWEPTPPGRPFKIKSEDGTPHEI